jgi:hypothetical protein
VTIPKNPIFKAFKFGAGFFAFLVSIYLPVLKWRKDPTQKDKEIIGLFYKKLQALALVNPQQLFIQSFYLIKRLSKFDMTKIETGPALIASMSTSFSWPGISFTLSKKVLDFAKDKIDMSDEKSVLIYKVNDSFLSFISGDWLDKNECDHNLINWHLRMGEFYFPTQYIRWNNILNIPQGNFSTSQWAVQKLSEISETYDNDFAKLFKYLRVPLSDE